MVRANREKPEAGADGRLQETKAFLFVAWVLTQFVFLSLVGLRLLLPPAYCFFLPASLIVRRFSFGPVGSL
jgi:hypothetical protein